MRLRERLAAEINDRIARLAPRLAETVWDAQGVVVIIEAARVVTAGGVDGDFEREVTITGTVTVELRADAMSLGVPQELIVSLVGEPILLKPEAVEPDALTERARAPLGDMRVLPRDGTIVHRLTLVLDGEIVRRLPPSTVPTEALIAEGTA